MVALKILNRMSTFKTHRDYQVCVQCTLIALLNEQYSFLIQRPVKKGNLSLQLINIRRIELNKDWIDVEAFVNKRCQDRITFDISIGIPSETAKQRVSKNKIFEQIHLLIDLSFVMGYSFRSSFTNGNNHSMIYETVVEIYHNNILILSTQEIESVGNKINALIYGRLSKQHSITLEQKDTQIISLLQTQFNRF
ncbi:hypothetical protein KM1_080610 [Entamoeba histolytica HM-3:IMSS]|nr:hypothetical protein KM1_080610 [Entamoeba histolytica HM-3:IMSS]GAT95274.1 hypothetical protein CL6EHI_165190 [Entamoeba histolytica]